MTMSAIQVNAALSSQSTESIDEIMQSRSADSVDTNGEPVMSKSKARSLRRKRAKQRKKEAEAMNGGSNDVAENGPDSQDKENNAAASQENKGAKKKRKPRKKKNKAKSNGETSTEGSTTEKTSVIVNEPEVETIKAKEVSTPAVESPFVVDAPIKEKSVEKQASPSEPETCTETSSVNEIDEKVALYEDEDASAGAEKDDCECACVIS